ncbi:MAG: cobalamin-dependent protein, partial [Candidatus Bipolaricaulota bacterium]
MKIALVAMSGVRAHNEELTQLGLTLPGFVERNKTVASLPSLGLLTLAGMTPDGFDVDYLEVADIREAESLPEGYDLVAISTFSAQVGEAYELADRYEALGSPVVMGGLHVSALPDEAKEHCTSVVVGEGEALWLEILADLKRG